MELEQRRRFAGNRFLPETERQSLFNCLWQEWHPRLRIYFRSFSGLSPEDGEELASDCLLRAFDKAHHYQAERPLSAWLYALARRQAISRLRAGSRKLNLLARGDDARQQIEELVAPDIFNPERQLLDKTELALAARLLNSLQGSERELAFLVYAEEMTLAEAAAVVGVPLGTIKWRMSRIRRHLRAQMEVFDGTGR